MKKIIIGVALAVSAIQLLVTCGFIKPVFSFSYSYAGDAIMIILVALAAVFLYMLPTMVAISRKHRNTAPIAVVNVFFGWTLIGFVGCLAWALINSGDKK